MTNIYDKQKQRSKKRNHPKEYTLEEKKKIIENFKKSVETFNKSIKDVVKMNSTMVANSYNDVVSSMTCILQKELNSLSTYELQKNGIDSRTYKRIMKNPEKLRGETVLTYLEKVEEIKKSKEQK